MDEEASRRRDHVDSLVAELTLEEKLRLVHGAADPDGRATGYVPPIDRLGIPSLSLVDGPLGVRAEGEPATAFPATLALAATWETSLARQQGATTAREARAYGQDALLAPGVNLVRVPHGGRNFEYFGEDPHLTSRLAVGFVEGVQSEDVIATVKHYVANNQETNRYVVSAEVSERALRELYLPAFRAAVEEAGVGSVMTAYNRVNGVHMSEHRRLLRDVLKGEWGFDGYVVSDWWGTESTVGAAEAGLDLEMPGAPFEELPPADALPDGVDPATIEFPDALPAMHEGGLFAEPLRDAVESGVVDEALVDEKVGRILRTMDRFGLFDDRP
jgi:beta-glucosidase